MKRGTVLEGMQWLVLSVLAFPLEPDRYMLETVALLIAALVLQVEAGSARILCSSRTPMSSRRLLRVPRIESVAAAHTMFHQYPVNFFAGRHDTTIEREPTWRGVNAISRNSDMTSVNFFRLEQAAHAPIYTASKVLAFSSGAYRISSSLVQCTSTSRKSVASA